MKKLILVAYALLGICVIVFAQSDSTAVSQSGFERFYDKYGTAIWVALGASGIIAWLMTKLKELRNAVDLLLAAGDDESPDGKMISLSEWQGIVVALKAVFWKGDTKKVNDLKKVNQVPR